MKRALLLGMLCCCEPSLHNGRAVRHTLSQHHADVDAHVATRADAAVRAVARWRTRSGVELGLAVRDAERMIALAAPRGDARLGRAVELFDDATNRIASSPAPLADAEVAGLADELSESKAEAVAARGADPTAASPTASLKALRKHQESDRQQDYGGTSTKDPAQ